MEDYIIALVSWALTTEWAAYVMVVLAFIGFVGKLLAVLPVTVTEKVPDWLMVILNVVGANWGNAKNALTDMKGNKVNQNANSGTSGSDPRATG